MTIQKFCPVSALPKADIEHIHLWLDGINQFNSTPGKGVTRWYLTEAECQARDYLFREMQALGLEVSIDCMGNVLGTLPGSERELAPVWTGSHFDTVLYGGRYDGAAGVVAGLEAIRLIADSGLPHRRDLTVIAFAAEEPARFGIGCIGSRAMSGDLDAEKLNTFRDADGISIYEELKAHGYEPERIGSLRRHPGDVFCSLELHIEQNVNLEQAGKPVGIVKAICAPLNFLVTVTGQAAHSGGMPMTLRRDAFAAVSEMSLALERIAKENTLSEYCTGTIGALSIHPNVSNIIPERVEFTVDIRDCSKASMDALHRQVEAAFGEIAARRGVGLEMRIQNNDTPIPCHPRLMELCAEYAALDGYETMPLISGPFHDSLFLGKFTDIGMLFVPSKDGLSHCPEESTRPEDITAATDVLAQVLLDVANRDSL